jgi:copper oxidase (laccase) domain-containing protein
VEIETFPALKLPGIRHGFSTRSPSSLDLLDAELMTTFAAAGFPMERAVHAEQPHGNRVAIVEHEMQERVKDVDALATSLPQLPLVVRVADCGPVFFYDPVRRAIAVAHSGRRGTEGNIVAETIAGMVKHFGSRPGEIVVQLGPCIRPPRYEVDFAAEIGRQARAAGVENFYDGGICTARDLSRYYSYRAERGKTGRMWGVLTLE